MNTENTSVRSEGSAEKQPWSTPALSVLLVASETEAQAAAGADGGVSLT